MKKATLAAVLALAMWQVQAGVPHLVNFQGRLTDTAGDPITAAVDVTFSLYDAVTAGSVVWTEAHAGVLPSVDGVFAEMLGGTTALTTAILSAGDLWLEIDVEGEILAPRYRLAAAAFAVIAEDADTLDTLDSTDFAAAVHNHDAAYVNITGDTMTGPLTATFLSATNNVVAYEDVYIGGGSTVDDDTAFFDNGAEYLRWDDNPGEFDLSDDLNVVGNVAASGNVSNSAGVLTNAGVDYGYAASTAVADGANVNVTSVTITAPSAGRVLVIGQGYANYTVTGGATDRLDMQLSDNPTPGAYQRWVSVSSNVNGIYRTPFTVVYMYTVAAGDNTFYLHADSGPGAFTVFHATLSGMFFPNQY